MSVGIGPVVLTFGVRTPPPWTPAAPASLAGWWESRLGLSQDDAGATPVTAAGQPVGRKPDRSAAADHRTQASAGLRPAAAAWAGGLGGLCVSYDGAARYLSGAGRTFAGALTVYATGTLTALASWLPCASSGGAAQTLPYGTREFVANAGGFKDGGYTGATGAILARWRRTAAGVFYFAATGLAEVQLGQLDGDVTFDTEGGFPALTTPLWTTGTHRTTLAYADDLTATGEEGDAMNYLGVVDGVTL